MKWCSAITVVEKDCLVGMGFVRNVGGYFVRCAGGVGAKNSGVLGSVFTHKSASSGQTLQ